MKVKSNESGRGSYNAFPVDLVSETKVIPFINKVSKEVFVEPTAEELSRVTFAKLRDLRIHAQELRNRFASLLNRGSSLE